MNIELSKHHSEPITLPVKKQCKLGDIACTLKQSVQAMIAPRTYLAPYNSSIFTNNNDTMTAQMSHVQPINNTASNDTLATAGMSLQHKRASSPLQTLCSMACQERTISAPMQLPTSIASHASVLYQPDVKREDSDISDFTHITMNTDTSTPSRSSYHDTVTPGRAVQATVLDKTTEKKLKHIQTDRDRRARIKNSLQQLRILLGMGNENNVEQSTILSSSVTMIAQLQQENHALFQQLQAIQANGQYTLRCPTTATGHEHTNNAANNQSQTHIAAISKDTNSNEGAADHNLQQEVLQLREHVNTLQCRLDRELKANSLLNLERRELSNKIEQLNAINQQLSMQLSCTINKTVPSTTNDTAPSSNSMSTSQSMDTLSSDITPLRISPKANNHDPT